MRSRDSLFVLGGLLVFSAPANPSDHPSESAGIASPAEVSSHSAPAGRTGRIVKVAHQPSDMVVVPAGSFTMGPSEDEVASLKEECRKQLGQANDYCIDERLSYYLAKNLQLTDRQVHLDAYAIDRYEVSSAQYRQCVSAGYCDVGALLAGDERYLRRDWPMVNVTWQDAVDYCTWAGKRLPTEAEWEKAARGTQGFRWPWGNHVRIDGSNHGRGESATMQYTHAQIVPRYSSGPSFLLSFAPDRSDGYDYAAPPGALRWSEGPYGTYDMAGNAAEWVQDYYSGDGYDGLPAVNPVREVPDPSNRGLRAVRGGSWAEPRFFGRTYYRAANLPNVRVAWVGFRCARDLD